MRNNQKLIKYAVIIFVTIIIIGYTYFQTKNLLGGPVLSVYYPVSGMTVNKSLIEVRGFVKNVSFLKLNDRQIYADEEGKFSEQLLLSYGYNIIKLEVEDKFERIKLEEIEIIYKENY